MQSRKCDKVLEKSDFVMLFIFFSQKKNVFISLRNKPFPKFLHIICWLLCIFKDVFEIVEISFKEKVYSGVVHRETLWRRIEMDVLNLE